jgi:hypothetical protein
MALLGNGALVIWNDVAPGSEDEFNHWHMKEHMPERLAVPGFLRGRRYTAETAQPRYFTLYETASVETLESAPYVDRLNDPTPWSRQVFPLWRNTSRTACRVSASLGQGMGGCIAALTLSPDPGREEALRAWLIQHGLPELLTHPEVVGGHLGEDVEAVTQIPTEEKRERGSPDALVSWVVLVEGTDAQRLADTCAELLSAETLREQGGAAGGRGVYRLAYALGPRSTGPS